MHITQICANCLQIEDGNILYLQSYDTVVGRHNRGTGEITLSDRWNCSKTTSSHVSRWLSDKIDLTPYRSANAGVKDLIKKGEIKVVSCI